MSFEFEQPDEFGGGNFLKQPGTYHFSVMDVSETDKDGNILDGFRASLEVLHGTVQDKNGDCTETGKACNVTFWNGKLNHKDGGKFARQRQAAFLVAAGIIGPQHIQNLLKKSMPPLDLSAGRGAQIVMTVELSDDGKYIQVSGADVWHIDDPNAAAFPKHEGSLSVLDQSFRRTPEQLQAIKDAFSGKASGGNGQQNGNGQAQQPTQQTNQQQPAMAGAGAGGGGAVNLEGL